MLFMQHDMDIVGTKKSTWLTRAHASAHASIPPGSECQGFHSANSHLLQTTIQYKLFTIMGSYWGVTLEHFNHGTSPDTAFYPPFLPHYTTKNNDVKPNAMSPRCLQLLSGMSPKVCKFPKRASCEY